jgi:hypothetical protein
MEEIVFTKTPWPIISDEKYSMVRESWQLAIEAQDRQQALAGAPVGAPSMYQLPGGSSLKIDLQTREAVSVYSIFCSWIRFMMMLNPKKFSWLKLKISTVRGHLADGAHRTIVLSNRLDLGSETELQIQVKELLFDDVYLSKVIDNKKAWFTQMEVLDLIYHQFFLTTNSLGQQPTTSQFFQPLTPQTLALVATAIHYALSEYATGKMVTVMFSQDEYRGKFCPSTVMDCISAEATALINYTWWGCFIPSPWFSSAIIGAPQSPSALLRYHRRSSIPIGAPQL